MMLIHLMSSVLAIFGDREGVETSLVGRVLLYVTTHASNSHLLFWRRWPRMLSQVPLNDFDVFVYFTNPHPPAEWFHTLPLIGNRTGANPGYQQGAMQAVHDTAMIPITEGYDWIIRLNPDALILDVKPIYHLMQDPGTDAILGNCLPAPFMKVMTDFTVLRRHVFISVLKQPTRNTNAELDMTACLTHTLGPDFQRTKWVYNAHGVCRIELKGQVMHQHDPKYALATHTHNSYLRRPLATNGPNMAPHIHSTI